MKARIRYDWESNEDFVRVWQRAEYASDVADAFDMNIQTVCSRAHRLRERGVPLKMFQRGRRSREVNLAILTRLAKEAAKDVK